MLRGATTRMSMSLFGWQNSTKMLRDRGCRRLRCTAYATSSVPPSSGPSPDSEAKCGNGNKSEAEHGPEEQVRQKISFALRRHLQSIQESGIDLDKQAMAERLKPGNFCVTAKQLAKKADDLVYEAGDHSFDPLKWYPRRAALAGALVAMELYMLTDNSDGKRDTWEFVDRISESYSSATNPSLSAQDVCFGFSTAATALGSVIPSLLEPAAQGYMGLLLSHGSPLRSFPLQTDSELEQSIDGSARSGETWKEWNRETSNNSAGIQ
eukprot:521274_1